MIYQHLFQKSGKQRVRVGLIGTGTYGISLLAQAQLIPRLDIAAICDRDVETARRACQEAGLAADSIAICSSREAVLRAVENGQLAIAEDCALLLEAPLDVIVECTGHPEAGARHAEAAIQRGMHVVMVNKETDSVIGPLLHEQAQRAGVVYTPVDGDQPALLIGLVMWARSLGLEVISGGKARPYDFVYDERARTVTDGHHTVSLTAGQMAALAPIQPGQTGNRTANSTIDSIAARREILSELSFAGEADLCEAVIAANATGLYPDVPALHAPVVRTTEIPTVLCTADDGGILERPGAIEVVTCLRRADEPGLGGGVFIVVKAQDDHTWRFLREKGLLTNPQGSCGVLYRPYHLLGVETPVTILCAALLNVPTGSADVLPHCDLVARTRHDLAAGTLLEIDHTNTGTVLEPLIFPATALNDVSPLPLYLAVGNRLAVDVPAGTILTRSMITPPQESRLWALRRELDQRLL